MTNPGRLMSQTMKIMPYDSSWLTTKTEELSEWNESLSKICQGMMWMMLHHKLLGLSANQIGLSRRFFIMKSKNRIKIIVNPRLISIEDEGYLRDIEICPSFSDTYQHLIRPTTIKVLYLDNNFSQYEQTLTGTDARTFCHELDHLDGILMTDYMNPGERHEFLQRHRKAL